MAALKAVCAGLMLLFLTGCNPVTNTKRPKTLEPVEVREYKGEKLSSSGDFHENSIRGPQHVRLENYRLKIRGLVDSTRVLTYEQVLGLQHYTKVVRLFCVEGWDVNILWEGVLVRDLLDAAGVKPEARNVIFHAQDGYTTSLPLDYIRQRDIVLAARMNGLPLKPERGFPFELVAEDKLGYKWIKWVTEIELSDNVNYKGYWESRGYSNNADVR
jgi:DMSO/TMAO reductase YedYZ molybdopterin-dependent catalytic subunit